MPAAPPFTGRDAELQLLRNVFAAASAGRGSLTLISGAAGIGKTRLLTEAIEEAKRRGFSAGLGVSFAESLVLYQAWNEALSSLNLEHLLQDEPPPRLLALYLVSKDGLPVVRAERPGFSEDAALLAMMLNNAAEFLRDAIKPAAGSAEGDLMRFAVGGRGVCVARAQSVALLAVYEGRETEIFLREVRRLVEEVTLRAGRRMEGWDGNKRAVADLGEPLTASLQSGKFDGVDMAADGQARKFNLYDNVLFGLRRRARMQPVLLVLDDLQWAEASSLGLLHYVARNTKDAPILLVGAFRSEERETRPQLREALVALAREDLADEIHLGRLSGEETKAFAEGLLGPHRIGAEFFERLASETEGNPLMVREVVRQLQDEGAIVADPANGLAGLQRPLARISVPNKIRDAVSNRVAGLETDDRELLDAASVCGTRFAVKLLSRVVQQQELPVARRLNSIARRDGIVVPEAGAWRFDHPVVREVVYDAIPHDLRTLLHREAGEALVHLGGEELAVGEHFAEAGDARALPPLESGARAAMERGAPYEAARLLERAAGVASGAEKARLQFSRAESLEFAAQYEEALAAVLEAATLGADGTRCALLRGSTLKALGRYEEVLRVVEEALAAAPEATAGKLLTLRARALVTLARYDEAEEAARLALTKLSKADPGGRADALIPLSSSVWYRGQHAPALELMNEALHLRESVGDRRGVCEALLAIGNVQGDQGETQRASEFLRLALALAEKIGDRSAAATSRLNLANALADLWDLEGALEESRRASAAAEAIGNPTITSWCEFIQGLVLARRGKTYDALVLFERCAARARKYGEMRLLSSALAESVSPRLRLRERDRARDDAEEAFEVAQKAGLKMFEAVAMRARGEVAAADGDFEAMNRHFEAAEALFGRLKNATEAAETHVRWAEGLRAAGRSKEARTHWTTAAGLFDQRNLRKRSAMVRTALVALPS